MIIAEKSSDTDTSDNKSADEMHEKDSTEVKSGDESGPEGWFPVQSKDYSDTGTKSVVPETDDYAVKENFGTAHGSDTFALPTMPAPLVLPPTNETSCVDTVSVNQFESMENGLSSTIA